jgi:hypothetical protein
VAETTSQKQRGTEKEEQEWQEIDSMDLAMKEDIKAAGETATKARS